MRIDGLQLREGSYITNMSIAAGSAFPNSPNTGELFYRTDSENVGLHVYDSSNTSWNKCFTSGDVALSLPANTTPGTYKSVTVNNQGIVSAGTNPTTLAGYGIVDAQALDADLTAIAALAGTSGLLKKTAADTWTLDTNTYLTSNQTITLTGGVTGSGTTSINATVVTNANLTGVVTSVGNATSIANGAISNGMLANGSITLGSTNIVLGSTTTTLAGLISVTSTGFTGALNGTVGATTPNTGVFTSVSVSGKISSTTDSTSPADGSAYFYKSSPGAVVSGYQVIIETGLAGNRTTKATFDNIGNLGLGNIPSAWSFGGNIQMTSAACLTFNGPSYIGSNFYNNGGWRYTDTAPSSIYSQTSGRHIWSNAVSGSIGALISFVQGMELDANNNLIVTGSISGTSFNSITGLSSTLPAAAGTAAIGVSTTAARSDHVHGLQTSVSGTAGSLATGRTFSLSTDATGTSAAFDGSANVTIPMTLATVNSNVGSFGSATQVASITLDAKGRATAASNVSIAIPTSAVTSGTFADARIATSNVTQHQASLTIAETQITDGTLLARNAGNETISGNWTFSNVVTGVTPSAASHLTTKAYVDGLVTGLDTKASCRAATTANITLSGTQTIDGVAVIAGNRVLVKDQSTASQNGIYDVAAGAWVRSADADNLPGAEVTAGMYTFISEGTVNADTGWTLSTNDTVVLGTTPLTFTQFTGLGQISAGAGLTKTGSVIDIGTASASRIVINTDNIDLATAGTAGTYRSVTTDAYGRVTNGTNPTTLAGYGITDAVTAVSVVTANGVSGSVTSTTTPAITLTLGAITPTSVTATGQIAAQSSIFNNTTGTSSTWQHNSTSVGDIGTGNQVISGGSSADFGVTSRAGKLVLGTGSIARATIDTSGNLGLGVTPSAWSASARAFQFGSLGMLFQNASGYPELAFNTYQNTSNIYTYKNTDVATRYIQSNGSHQWFSAPSGTAGNAITFTQAMTLNASGNLGLGVTPTAFFLDAGPALQINKFSIQQIGGFDVTALTTNGYQSSAGVMKYIGTASATRYRHANGAHYWDKAPSGTADTVIAFTQQMILDVNSNLAVIGSVNTATGLNITGNGGFFNGANKFGIDHISGTSRFYSSGPDTTTRGVFEFHPISSNGSLDFIAMKLFDNGRLHLTASTTNQVLQSFTGVGGTNAYVDFAAVEIGGQTANGAWLRWTRGGSNDRVFSIHTTNSSATPFKTLTADHTGIQIIGAVTTTGGVDKLTTASGAVSVAAATAPTTGQVLTATSATTATWQASSTVAAAGTLTGTTLAANVVNSSLTSLGTLTSPLSINAVTQDTTTTAVTTTSATVVDSVSSSAFRTAKYIVQVTDSTNSQYHAVEILVIHDGTTVYKTEYGEITTAASLGTFDAAIVTGTLRLSFTATAATTKSVKVYRAAITA